MKTVKVVGSGISGLSISRMLATHFEVEILEKNELYGGLIKCERVNDCLFHRVGGHVFNSKNKLVLEWFWNQFDKKNEFLAAKRNAKILFDSKLIGYPIENYIYQLPETEQKEIFSELISKLSGTSGIGNYVNFKEFLIGNFGLSLYNLYFGPYNSKIWNTDLEKVPLEWLDGKLPMPKIEEILVSNLIRTEESEMVHSSFFYPKYGGSQFIVERLAKDLDITCSYTVESIEITREDKLSINRDDKLSDSIVYCGDIRFLHDIINIENAELKTALFEVSQLSSNGTSNVFCETDETNLSWLYLPEKKFRAHRIIYTGNFSETNNNGSARKTCVVEFSGKVSQQEINEELKLLPGNLSPLAYNYEPNSYIIHDAQTAAKVKKVKNILEAYNIYLLGRFAEWEYYNMDKCIEAAMELKSRFF